MTFIVLHRPGKDGENPEVVLNSDHIVELHTTGDNRTYVITSATKADGAHALTVVEPLDVVMETLRRNGAMRG